MTKWIKIDVFFFAPDNFYIYLNCEKKMYEILKKEKFCVDYLIFSFPNHFLCTARPSLLQNSANWVCGSVKKVGQWAWVPQPLTWLQSNGVGENNRFSEWWMLSFCLYYCSFLVEVVIFPVWKVLVKLLILISVVFLFFKFLNFASIISKMNCC